MPFETGFVELIKASWLKTPTPASRTVPSPHETTRRGLWLMEQFHGPTLAFKDYLMQLIGRFFDHIRHVAERRTIVFGANSG